jgi:FtsZ-binding cell division protein ZapB
MADLNSKLQQVKSGESFLERIKRYIPGYDGYVNRDNSRELDIQLRNTLAKNLDSNKTRLKNTILNLSKLGKLFESDGIDKLEKKLETAAAKFRSAARGYSGAFDVVKIKEERLNQVYEFDANMLDDVNEISNACSELEANSKANTDIKEAQDKMSARLDNLLNKFDERENILRNL